MTHNEEKVQGFKVSTPSPADMPFSPRRGTFYDIEKILSGNDFALCSAFSKNLVCFDIVYRTLCGIMFNFVPSSGHPGGSISSGRIVQGLIFNTMDYDISDPDRRDNDHLAYAAGHKAMGLYAAWALRNECVRIGNSNLLPDEKRQLRLEDLLGFRRNPVTTTPLYIKHNAKALDGHPTPNTPFVKLATGASGFGVSTSIGFGFGALDTYGENAPRVHILEGEGGMTPGRVAEAMAAAGTNQLENVVMHLDWNQASIDSNAVCRDGSTPGDYVQWNPMELAYINDWNVVYVADGFDHKQIIAAQHLATNVIDNKQPTAVVYRTIKGWRYGIEGRGSHGAGHGFCSEEFYASLEEFKKEFGPEFPGYSCEQTPDNIESVFYEFLMLIRRVLEDNPDISKTLTERIETSKARLDEKKRKPRPDGPNLKALYANSSLTPENNPAEITPKPGESQTHRGVLGNVLNYLNHETNGAFVGSAADLFGSTSLSNISKGMKPGYFNYASNPEARLIMIGGICEDGIGGFMAGASAYGSHIGVGSSYGAFIAALQHVTARLHCIGQEARKHAFGDEYNPFIIVCGHAGPKTGEDGPTHADPQGLQLVSENFPKGSLITLTPWDTQEIWPLVIAALQARPAVLVPFVTRPGETVVDRAKFNLPPASEAAKGIYALRRTDPKAKKHNGTIVLQGNGVASEFVTGVLPELDRQGVDMNVYYVASAELFDLLPDEEQRKIFPESQAREAMGITEFTLPTMYRWVTSIEGRRRTIHPFKDGHFLGSGKADKVFEEGGLHAEGQLEKILDYAKFIENL